MIEEALYAIAGYQILKWAWLLVRVFSLRAQRLHMRWQRYCDSNAERALAR